jgi:hypothetical protein
VRSKKRSPISPTLKLLEQSTPLFLDHNLGNKQLPELLRLAGFTVVCHVPTFDKEEDDDVWIRECAKRGWVIVTSDKNIETDPVNRLAVIESEARIFFLNEGGCRAILWAAALIVSKEKIWQIVLSTKGPFLANVARETPFLVTNVRNPNDGPPPAQSPPSPGPVEPSPFADFLKF